MQNRTKEQNDFNYKKIHAMYSKGYSIDDICNGCQELERWEVIDIIQKVEGKKHQAQERAAR